MAAEPVEAGGVAGGHEARWWPALLALVALGVAYAFVSANLTLGPPWLLLAVLALGGLSIWVLRWRELWVLRRYSAVLILSVATIAVGLSAVYLLQALLRGRTQAGDLLRDAALLWGSNVLVFALWYWELDGGGPAHRHQGKHDFVFPQMTIHHKPDEWTPEFLDYLFLAFNTSTAFSPTDTMVLARRAKVLMMLQSLISLVTIAVLAARAINTL
jgi:uncharacterized membrane protein